MFDKKTLLALEFDKIMAKISNCAVLGLTKDLLNNLMPTPTFSDAKILLDKTEEAYKLLYQYNVNKVYYFSNVEEELFRVDKGGVLNISEILRIVENLKGARLLKNSIYSVNSEDIVLLREISLQLFTNLEFEKDISRKIISEDEISDNASPKLFSVRKKIRDIKAKIRDKLNSYMRGTQNKFLQDSVVTMRQDKYVIPVKSEYRSSIKGNIYDQSSTGSTVFIEPEQVMELNNDLKMALFEEVEEINKILREITYQISFMTSAIRNNQKLIVEIDSFFARAEYSFNIKAVRPVLSDNGETNIICGRHPLINSDKVVPISLTLGKDYNFLLISGPNTGGKTVTLKLVGLFSIMAMCGIFVPAYSGTIVSVFNGVYSDIGDEQSIEQDLSTFSSHIKNLINIIDNIDDKSLVLLDEIGAGTDPEEGSALALAIIKRLIRANCFGIITTHYAKLKEFAMDNGRICNASMEFDAVTLKPLYKINIGIPGSSNAIEIAKTLGLEKELINEAIGYLSDNKIGFEKILRKAEETRMKAENLSLELERIKKEKEIELETIKAEKERISQKREKIYALAKQETKQIVSDKLVEAEEIIDELKSILKKVGLESKEVFRASELKNRLKNSRYLQAESDEPFELVKINQQDLAVGKIVYVKSLGVNAKIVNIKGNRREVEVLVGDAKIVIKANDIYNAEIDKKQKANDRVIVRRNVSAILEKAEINIIGKTTLDGVEDVKNFIDNAVVCNLEEVKIIHGIGEGKLLKAVRSYLNTDKNVLEFRAGKYGEGENGVTIVKLR